MTDTRLSAAPATFGKRVLDEIVAILRAAIWFVPAWVLFNTVGWAQYSIPSESMVPTLEVGDRVLVSKYAYGYSRFSVPVAWRFLPEGDDRLFARDPRRGDVAVFAHPFSGRTMIKRVIGLPGDMIEIRDGVLSVNGEAARYLLVRDVVRAPPGRGAIWNLYPAVELEESLAGRRHAVLDIDPQADGDSYGPIVIPAGRFLMVGDNRDNSADGRFPEMGLVSAERLIGRAETVIFAPKGCSRFVEAHCTRSRWMRPLSEPTPDGA